LVVGLFGLISVMVLTDTAAEATDGIGVFE
jgi:hypothetical protein